MKNGIQAKRTDTDGFGQTVMGWWACGEDRFTKWAHKLPWVFFYCLCICGGREATLPCLWLGPIMLLSPCSCDRQHCLCSVFYCSVLFFLWVPPELSLIFLCVLLWTPQVSPLPRPFFCVSKMTHVAFEQMCLNSKCASPPRGVGVFVCLHVLAWVYGCSCVQTCCLAFIEDPPSPPDAPWSWS